MRLLLTSETKVINTMLADKFIEQIPSGSITHGIEEGTSINAVLEFIENNLPEFSLKNKGQIEMNEKGLTQRLCIQLNRNLNDEPFFFDKEHMEKDEEGNSPSIDLGVLSKKNQIEVLDRVYREDEAFFSLEAKRLGKVGKSREREYIVGRLEGDKYIESGGIERFKKCIHGGRLKIAAMIGYVQVDDSDIWHNRVNEWIGELIKVNPLFWFERDMLSKNYSQESFHKFTSINYRIKDGSIQDKITLVHFWVNLVL